MKRAAFILLALIAWPGLSLAAVKTINFENPPTSLNIGEVGKLVIKFFTADGQGVPAGETVNLGLQSSCASGQFSSNSTNWEAVSELRVNSNWSSRTFYYKDESAGSCEINVKALEKDWSPAQTSITVGSIAVSSDDEDGESSNNETTSVNPVAEDKKERKTITSPLSIDIGKKLTITAGVPMVIKPKIKGVKEITGVKLAWSLGDGAINSGPEVDHIYEYPGEYLVAVVATSGEEEARAQIEVDVIEPKLTIEGVATDGRAIALMNKSGSDLKLDGTKLLVADKFFSFPANTSMKKDAKISIPRGVSNLVVLPFDTVRLVSATGAALDSYYYNLNQQTLSGLDQHKISTVKKELDQLAIEIKQIKAEYAKMGIN